LKFEDWGNFYVIASAAAATLLGLLFVVITLAAERGRKDRPTIGTYLTPAVIYFSSVLLMSAILTGLNQTRLRQTPEPLRNVRHCRRLGWSPH
jgi:hypothetical protein